MEKTQRRAHMQLLYLHLKILTVMAKFWLCYEQGKPLLQSLNMVLISLLLTGHKICTLYSRLTAAYKIENKF